jgi:hypothetical protein
LGATVALTSEQEPHLDRVPRATAANSTASGRRSASRARRISNAGGALSAILKTAQAWLARRRGSSLSVKIGDDELVLTGASTDEQRRVIEDWLARREAAEAANG